MDYKQFMKDKNVLIIGGTGTVGKKIVEETLKCDPKVVRIFSRDEYKQFVMADELKQYQRKVRFLIGDVRDGERLERASKDIDIIFHLAAMKHVPACEYNPFEAVKTNVLGTQNVIEASLKNNVSRVIFTSSDKAISPTNSMGATKLLAERLMSAADGNKGWAETIFSCVRFGNVMGSRGSVIPLFEKQILETGKVTITDGEMTRFMMSMTEAANLTMEAAVKALGGEIFVLKMPVLKTGDLADVVIETVCEKHGLDCSKIEKEIIGLRDGEKMYEELMTQAESEFAFEFEKMYAIVRANHRDRYANIQEAAKKEYSSHDIKPISKAEIREIIFKEKII